MLSNLQAHANELKSQGAAEAARDPNSTVTAQDAERIMIEETKKTGRVALHFNPDASPEEKAAQARSHLPSNFHHEHKPKGVGIATDIDDGTAEKYDLPSPNKERALAPPSPQSDDKPAATNGHVPEDEDAKWKHFGWAPRIGPGSFTEADANESLLDHQTWVESKLGEKFYGDWYHNTAVIVFACLASWICAVLGGGLAWLFLIMACCGTYYRTSIRRVRRNFRDDVDREMAKTRLETDSESLEWINSFLVKFWPIFEPLLCEMVVKSVDQILSVSTPAFLESMRMQDFILGTKPPRLEHVKTYPKAEDDIVLMDWKFSFTPNDTLDMTARQLKYKLNPKVVLAIRIGKGLVSKAIHVIVEDFAFSGLMRVKCRLQVPFPHIEKVEICFLGRPDIDYVCKPLGGDTLGFDINFIPGLESFIKDQIHGNLSPMMYEPNVFPIEIAKMLAGNPVDQAIGVLAVTIHGAQSLKNSDKLAGTPDPYTVVSLNSRAPLGRTKTIKGNANPRWNETIFIIITSLNDALTLQVYDFNEIRTDKMLGTATFALDQLEQVTEHENLQLEVMGNGKSRGNVQTDVRFFPVLEGTKLQDGTMEPPPESNTGIARFTIEQAKDLDGSKSFIGQLNPYAILLLNKKPIHTTRKLKRTNNPVWDDGSKEFLITDRKAAKLGLVIKDDRDLGEDPVLGTWGEVKFDDMIESVEKGQVWYNLNNAKTGRIHLMLQWKPIALKGITGGSGGYITPIGVMRIHFQNARDVRNVDTMGKSDPYVRVLLSGIEKGRTVTFQNDLNPDWDEIVYVPMHSARERLTLEVMDEEHVGNDRSLGLIELAAAEYIHQDDNGEYKVYGSRRQMSEPLRMKGKGVPKGTLNFTASFYPTFQVADPEDEEAEKATPEAEAQQSRQSVEKGAVAALLENGKGQEQAEHADVTKPLPKLRLTSEDLVKYESGLLIFKLIEADLAHSNVRVEVVMDDMVFPSFVSSTAMSRQTNFGETGDAFVRELDVSKITLRLKENHDRKGEDNPNQTIAKLVGSTLDTLQRCLYKPTEVTLKGSDGATSRITVSLKYLPVKMHLDPSESINNMGSLRVDVLDAADLPSGDRNGYSDPYCKFVLNGKEVYKTKIQKKTLHPAWNEFFEVPISSRTAADFRVRVMDWDLGDKDDLLGGAVINLTTLEPMVPQEVRLALDGKSGVIRLRLRFTSAYVTRSRQGSSTFSGTFATPGKVVGAPVKGVTMVSGAVGGGVVKGASFLRHGFKSRKDSRDISNGTVEPTEEVQIPNGVNGANWEPTVTPQRAVPIFDGSPSLPQTPPSHTRSRSFGGGSSASAAGGSPGKPEQGTAVFSVLSASGYPASAKVQVHIKQLSPKGAKDVYKTKAVKSSSGHVQWEQETAKVNCTPDTQFQVQVKDHTMFGGDDLGDALFFVDDSSTGSEKTVTAGEGTVVLRSSFTHGDSTEVKDSPRGLARRSLLGKGR
ncbi:MAG: putative transmembrane [Lasallia pustulata]|uniref:Putative transmembrane n=1 Tax=Lasallia pustulata TaxID=136370 RepID=A0A5M8Q3W1_9LECA|nr:MAG: putative transmembrane [Lasallia pustulata]